MDRKLGIVLPLLAIGGLMVLDAFSRAKEPKIRYVKKLYGNYNARTIPPTGIYISEEQRDNKELLNHERVHWKQYQKMGLLGFYISALIAQLEGYDNSPMEKEARKNESEYCQNNYTECVRNGQSKTVHNKNFRT